MAGNVWCASKPLGECLGRVCALLAGEGCSVVAEEAKTTPIYRAVEAQTGQLAPVTMASAYVLLEHLAGQRDKAVKERDDARTERDNMVDLTGEVGRLGAYLRDVLAERDDAERECGELRDQLEAARCRLDELEGAGRQRADDL
jgi:hypothetical protein